MAKKRALQTAEAAGIIPDYINAEGQPQVITATTQQRLLAAMRHTVTMSAATGPLPAVQIFTVGKMMALPVTGEGMYQWSLFCETDEQYEGEVSGGETLSLPENLPEGYHLLTLTQDERYWHCQLIIAPGRCYEPPALQEGKKLWGACVQLYTLRSESNWGIGDFGDLRAMLPEIARRGGAFIGLNPIHALYPANPESVSPYSPSSRHWLNVIYIDVNAVADFHLSEAAQAWWQSAETQQALKAARHSDNVDYTAVSMLKITALRMAWQRFSTRRDAEMTAFRQFIAQGGDSLYWQAAFDALHSWLAQQQPCYRDWTVWPQAYQDNHSQAVKEFCYQQADEVDFYLWLQWLAHTQFADCWQVSQQAAMTIGLYRDLAVGVAEGGAETWRDRDLYCMQASTGAPPDRLGPTGQNWGLPPMDPHVIVARDYQPFISLLRANMQHCGALRIDHVMSVLRLWWIPRGETADHGAYVRYPVDDLLAILALESQRHRCMVIGEDLGTVPAEVVDKLRQHGVYSYKVLYFEHDKHNHFHLPQHYLSQAMAVVATHDLPTLRGYWQSRDLMLGKSLGLYPDEVMWRQLYQERQQEKQGLIEALHQAGCLSEEAGQHATQMVMTATLSHAIQCYLAESHSALLGLQPEDWMQMTDPINIPGTSNQYPNWRRKLMMTLEQMFADKQINKLINELNQRRQKPR
ncbi:4-alpha-glucanotransferase [Enterobacteriaceae bacterium ESL0689]|nr:4-alpha-glucanotransferase [Enterobacteriaceae bacterium ESL0689]